MRHICYALLTHLFVYIKYTLWVDLGYTTLFLPYLSSHLLWSAYTTIFPYFIHSICGLEYSTSSFLCLYNAHTYTVIFLKICLYLWQLYYNHVSILSPVWLQLVSLGRWSNSKSDHHCHLLIVLIIPATHFFSFSYLFSHVFFSPSSSPIFSLSWLLCFQSLQFFQFFLPC